ncbi:MAG: thermonuclease family protein [Qipengyuania vulgaris]
MTALVFALAIGWFLFKDRLVSPPPQSEVAITFRPCGTPGSGPCVIDGDTLAIGQRRVRLTGYDAPEMNGDCKLERAKANQAKAQLHRWLSRGPFTWTGGEDPPRDRYGRELREARRGDDLLSEHMVSAGLAGEMGWGAERVEWCEGAP